MTDISTNVGPCGKPIDILRECKDELRSKKLLAEGTAKASVATVKGKKNARNFNVCFVLKAGDTADFYRNLDYYVAIHAANATETIQKNVDDLIKKSGDLEKAISEAAKAIKLIKDKAYEAKSKACDLDTQMKDPCNEIQLGILKTGFDNNCKQQFQALYPDQSNITFEWVIEQIISKTNDAKAAADKAFSAAVEISGIQTFSNVKSLKDLSKVLADKGKELKTDIDKNVKDSASELTKTQDELAKIVKEVSVAIMDSHKATTAFEGCAFTLDFVCDPKKPANCDISYLCSKVRQTFCGDEAPSPDKPGGFATQNLD